MCLLRKDPGHIKDERDPLEEVFRNNFTSQIMFDASDMHLERSFKAYDKDGDNTLDVAELLQGLLTGSGFHFFDYPTPFVRVLGLLSEKVLDDNQAKELSGTDGLKKRQTFFKEWGISYVLYRDLVTKLKFHVLFHPEIVKKMFKKTRFTRLMAQSPAIRFLRKLEMKKKSEANHSEKIQRMLTRNESNFDDQETENLFEGVSGKEWVKYLVSLDLIFTDVNTIQDQVGESSVADLNRATHDMGVVVSVQDYSIDSLFSKRHVNKDFDALRDFMSTGDRPKGTKVRWINAEQVRSKERVEGWEYLTRLRLCCRPSAPSATPSPSCVWLRCKKSTHLPRRISWSPLGNR